MNRLGALVLTGAAPVGAVLALAARQLVQDYYYARGHLRRIQTSSGDFIASGELWRDVEMDRRHAKWLAYASAVHMMRIWHSRGREWFAETPLTRTEHYMLAAFWVDAIGLDEGDAKTFVAGLAVPNERFLADVRQRTPDFVRGLEATERKLRRFDRMLGLVPPDTNRAISKALGYPRFPEGDDC